MVHIFTIHSHITFLSALGTVAYENLDTRKVIFICGGGYQPMVSEKFGGEIFESFDDISSKNSFLRKLRNFNYTKTCKQYINKVTKGESYTAYIDLMSVFNRYLVTQTNCIGFNIIEEGIVNYADYDDFNLWTADLREFAWHLDGINDWRQIFKGCLRLLRSRSLRLLAMPIHPNLYTLHKNVRAYCFSQEAFTYTRSDKKKILTMNTILPFVKQGQYRIPDKSWVWIGDTLSSAYKLFIEHFEDAILQLLEEINPTKEKYLVYLKFRGPETIQEKEITLKALELYNFDVEFIDYEVIMELEFLGSKNLKVMGIASSLLIYAHLMGHTTNSMFKFIPNIYGVSLANGYRSISKKVGFLQ